MRWPKAFKYWRVMAHVPFDTAVCSISLYPEAEKVADA
jgi:hypothetical protein